MKKINLIYLIYLLVMLVFFDKSLIYGKILLLSTIFFFVIQMFCYKRNQIFILLLIYSLTYFIYLLPYYFNGIYYAVQYNLITIENTNKLVFLQSFFSGLFFFFLKIPKNKKIKDNLKSVKEKKKIFYICFGIMIFICFFKLKGENIFLTKYGEKAVNNSSLEYYIIFFLIAYKYIKNKKLETILCLFSLFYACRLLLYGLRLAALFQIIMIFIFYFENRFRTIWIVFGSACLFVFFNFLSFYRIELSVENLSRVFGIFEQNGVRWLQTTQGDVWMSSSMYLDLKLKGIFDVEAQLKSIIGFWSSIFVPSRYVFAEAYFRGYAQRFYIQKVGGGGITAIYLYMWYGYFGIALFAYFLAKNINKAYKHKGSVYGVFLMVIFIRWYSYNILIVFKMGFYLILVNFILKTILSKPKNLKVGERDK